MAQATLIEETMTSTYRSNRFSLVVCLCIGISGIAGAQSASDSTVALRTLGERFASETKGPAAILASIGAITAAQSDSLVLLKSSRMVNEVASGGRLSVTRRSNSRNASENRQNVVSAMKFKRHYAIQSLKWTTNSLVAEVATSAYYPITNGIGFTVTSREYVLQRENGLWKVQQMRIISVEDGFIP